MKVRVGAGYKRVGREVKLWMEVENWPHKKVRETLGVERELAQNVWGSYEEFKKRYPHLYSTWDEYILDHWSGGVFNVDFLADKKNKRIEYTATTWELEEKGSAVEDLRKAVIEFLEASRDIYNALKNIPTEEFEKVIELPPQGGED